MSGSRSAVLAVNILTLGLARVPAVKHALRRGGRFLCRCGLTARARALNLDELGSTLIFSPHQDDETLGCGGLVAALRQRQLPVTVAFLTDGGASHRGHPDRQPAQVSALRAQEALLALASLGVPAESVHFLNAPDGELPRLKPDEELALVQRLQALLEAVQPRTILLPCRKDGSSEHEAAFRHVMQAKARSAPTVRILEFPVWSWWNPLLLVRPLFTAHRVFQFKFPELERRKASALDLYRSQTEPALPWTESILSPAFVAAFKNATEFFFES